MLQGGTHYGKIGYEIQKKMTPGFRQVNFTKTVMKYITSTDKIRGEEA